MKYTVNLVHEIRTGEKREVARKSKLFLISLVCFSVLGVSVLFSVTQIFIMQSQLGREKTELENIEAQYKKYKATQMMVDKSDVELLDKLQNGRIFWTRKLAAMAYHLPDNYWITKFTYDGTVFHANGFGNISSKQEQLIVLNDYFNHLRVDSMFNDVFPTTNFVATTREDEKQGLKVSFDFSSEKQKRAP